MNAKSRTEQRPRSRAKIDRPVVKVEARGVRQDAAQAMDRYMYAGAREASRLGEAEPSQG